MTGRKLYNSRIHTLVCSSKHAHRKLIGCTSNQLNISVNHIQCKFVRACQRERAADVLYGDRSGSFVDFKFLFIQRKIFETIKGLSVQFVVKRLIIIFCVSFTYIYAKSLSC